MELALEAVQKIIVGILAIPGFVGSVVLTIHINSPRREIKVVPMITDQKISSN